MKSLYKTISFCIITLFGFTSCSEDAFSSRYPDPSITEIATIEKLMSGVFKSGNNYTMPWYRRYYGEPQSMGRYAQTLGWLNDISMYQSNEGNDNHRWINFYKIIPQLRTLEDIYFNKFDDEQRMENEIFYLASRIYVYEQLAQMVDLWGDVPFTKAGYLPITIDLTSSKASYDKAEDLYKLMLSDLKEINKDLAKIINGNSKITDLVIRQMNAQDYINKGDIKLWQKFCNSLRLRIAARIADNGSLTTEAKTAIKEILDNPTEYPIITKNEENILIHWQAPDLQAIEGQLSAGGGIKAGLETWTGKLNRASKIMIEELAGDPRLPILIDKNSDGEYRGVDPFMPQAEQNYLFNQNIKGISPIDSATFNRNNKFPGIFITAAEIDLIRAEAYTKWGVAGDAREAFISGMEKSIEFYYYLNSLGDFRPPVIAPSAGNIATFCENKWNSEANKVKLIAIQKWLHYGNILMVEAWGEVRKTGYPELVFPRDNNSVTAPTPPDRLLYTNNEKNYNFTNYQAVQNKDTRYTKLFWAKP